MTIGSEFRILAEHKQTHDAQSVPLDAILDTDGMHVEDCLLCWAYDLLYSHLT